MVEATFSIHTAEVAGICIIELSGEVDATAARKLEVVLAALEQGLPPNVVVDTEALTLLNSRAVSLLVQFHRHVESHAGQCVLANLSPAMRERLSRFIGLDRLKIYDSCEQALSHLD